MSAESEDLFGWKACPLRSAISDANYQVAIAVEGCEDEMLVKQALLVGVEKAFQDRDLLS